ncbi:GMP synthase-Glutamine amidotransferase [Rhodococcus maanshanensis]|uniref:GMP synthase-Glutamine amidotransferase n=1 Tax=Rhodococcus maanshanensis TaxID=183556 RepID=A0A1H7YVR4_9NOCA|nr:GMP synthase-Glutamine amidotransferase [Rhodococcus maanshanensis]
MSLLCQSWPVTQTWWIIKHVAFEGPALIGTELSARGIGYSVCEPFAGDGLPEASECAGLVVMGGPMNALDDDGHPHLAAERALIRDCLDLGVPVIGVCLGAQLLAAALGANVFEGPAGEFGAGTVTLTDAAKSDKVFGGIGGEVPVVHWHGDTFDLPAGAVLLAGSASYPHQAFRVGENAYGLQFHVELTAAELPVLREHMPTGTAPDADQLAEIEAVGRTIIGAFLG